MDEFGMNVPSGKIPGIVFPLFQTRLAEELKGTIMVFDDWQLRHESHGDLEGHRIPFLGDGVHLEAVRLLDDNQIGKVLEGHDIP